MSGAMSTEEVEYWTNSMNQDDAANPPATIDSSLHRPIELEFHDGPTTGSHLETQYIVLFCVLGIMAAGLVMYCVFSMVQNISFDDLTEEDLAWQKANNLGESECNDTNLLDSNDGTCAICRKDTKGQGSEWQTTGVGGCGYLTCHECFIGYVPLNERCVVCGQFYCYRRGRVTFIDLQKDEAENEKRRMNGGVISTIVGEDDVYDSGDDTVDAQVDALSTSGDGLRRRVVQ